MIESQENRHARTNADAAQDRFVHAFVAANSEHVVRHLLEAERRRRFVRSTITADIDRDNFEVGREVGDLVHPQIMVKWIGVNHDEGKAFAGNFVVDFNAVGGAVHFIEIVTFKTYSTANGIKIYYEVSGEGFPFVMV